jgi:hypothetical protein
MSTGDRGTESDTGIKYESHIYEPKRIGVLRVILKRRKICRVICHEY